MSDTFLTEVTIWPSASREQSAGIEQVNQAVSQMDQMTQQNAALVEEATAASQAMATQARDLNALMSGYRVDDAATPIAVAPVRRVERRSVDRPWAKPKAPPPAAKPAAAAGSDVDWQEF